MRVRRFFAITAAVALTVCGAMAMAPVASAADTTLTVSVVDSDPVFEPVGLCGNSGGLHYVTRTVAVSVSGSYSATDMYVGSLDGCLYVYQLGGFNPSSPTDNNVEDIDDLGFVTLAAGEYTVVFAPYNSGYTGTVSYTLSGPGTLTFVDVSAPDLPRQIWFQSVARASADATCEDGYTSSWDTWPNSGTGGWVCNRQVFAHGQ